MNMHMDGGWRLALFLISGCGHTCSRIVRLHDLRYIMKDLVALMNCWFSAPDITSNPKPADILHKAKPLIK